MEERQKMLLQELDDSRSECIAACKDANEPGSPQQQLETISNQIDQLHNNWDKYFDRPATVASDEKIRLVFSELTGFAQELRLLKVDLKNNIFQGRQMAFNPNVAIFEEKNTLKRMLGFKVKFKSIKGKKWQINKLPVLKLTYCGSIHSI